MVFYFLFFSCNKTLQIFSVHSPNNQIKIKIFDDAKHINYQVFLQDSIIIDKSKLGLKFKNGDYFPKVKHLKSIENKTHKNSWELPWGESRKVINHYNEAVITFKNYNNGHIGDIIFRAYNDGIAFRYQFHNGIENIDSLVISDEITEFNLVEDAETWWISAYNDNRYENLYQNTKISKIDTAHTPLTVKYRNNIHLSFHEADLVNYSSMQIFSKNNILNCDLAPWPNGDKVRTKVPFESPWRTVIIAKEAKDLIASNLTLNCNDPNLTKDISWVSPGKYIGVWWGMITGKWTWGEGPMHGATNQRVKEYVDFASKHGFDEVLVEGWAAGWKGLFPEDTITISFTKSTPDIDISYLQDYALSKNVSLQLYHETSGNTKNYLAQIDSAFTLLNQLGIKNVKIGHVGAKLDKKYYHYSQYGVNYFRRVLDKALDYKIGVNFHEPIKDTGERRTYPNMLTREGARGMEYNAWPGGNPPNHTLVLPFTRLLGSPMDFTPGIFDLLLDSIDNHKHKEFPVMFTVIDSGNGYSNFRFKSSESMWTNKKMDLSTDYLNGKKINTWSIMEKFQAGRWEWGVTADLKAFDKDNIWIIESLQNKTNRSLSVDSLGDIKGQVSIQIPYQDFKNKGTDSIKGYQTQPRQRISTTLSKQLALYVIIYSPLQMASDFIENYKGQPALEFIKSVPVSWDTTIVLNGEIEKYLTIARKDKNSNDWFIGSISNETSRAFEFALTFLEEGIYEASIYSDTKQTDLIDRPGLYNISHMTYTSKDTIKIKMSSGGGQAIHFKYLY